MFTQPTKDASCLTITLVAPTTSHASKRALRPKLHQHLFSYRLSAMNPPPPPPLAPTSRLLAPIQPVVDLCNRPYLVGTVPHLPGYYRLEEFPQSTQSATTSSGENNQRNLPSVRPGVGMSEPRVRLTRHQGQLNFGNERRSHYSYTSSILRFISFSLDLRCYHHFDYVPQNWLCCSTSCSFYQKLPFSSIRTYVLMHTHMYTIWLYSRSNMRLYI